MWILHVPFSFETDTPANGPRFEWGKLAADNPTGETRAFWRLFGEVQFACANLQPIGEHRGNFSMCDRLEDFGKIIFAEYNRKPSGSTPEKPVTLPLFAERIHTFAREYVKLWPLVAVHAARLSRFEDMANAVTFVACAVPLIVVHGQVTYKPPAPGSTESTGAA